jgi:hypothetical protein
LRTNILEEVPEVFNTLEWSPLVLLFETTSTHSIQQVILRIFIPREAREAEVLTSLRNAKDLMGLVGQGVVVLESVVSEGLFVL